MEENIVRSFTGHIILVSDEETKDNVLFTPMAKPLKILRDYDKISALLRQQDFIKDFIPMTRGGVAILGGQEMNFMLTFGCNFDDFQRVFGNPVKAVEGELLTNGDHGLLVNVNGRQEPAQDPGLLAGPRGLGAEQGQPQPRRPGRSCPSLTRREVAWPWKASASPTPRTRTLPIKGRHALQVAEHPDAGGHVHGHRDLTARSSATTPRADVVQTLPPEQEALLAAGEEDLFGGGGHLSPAAPGSTVAELEKTIHAAAKP